MSKVGRTRRTRVVLGLAVTLGVIAALALGGGLYVRDIRRQDAAAAKLLAQVVAAIRAGKVSALPFPAGAPSRTADDESLSRLDPDSLATTALTVTAGPLTRDGDSAAAVVTVARKWTEATWSFQLPVRLVHSDRWQVASDQRLVHPDLALGESVTVKTTRAARAGILGAQQTPLVVPRPVVDVGVQPSKVSTAEQAASALAAILQIDGPSLARRIAAAKSDAFVDVITLRRAAYEPLAAKIKAVPGVVFREREQPLAPTKDFARALFGAVGPVTAEIVAASKGRYQAGDLAGLSGIQRQYDAQLAGSPGLDISGPAGRLFSSQARPGEPVVTTIDSRVQLAADAALVGVTAPAAIVVVDISSGEFRAVANSPSSGLNRAFLGKYAPGSTFKMVSAVALTQLGVKPTDIVPCPVSAQAGGATFGNYQDEQFGPVAFKVDFAKSCNTAFVGLSSKLADSQLQATAKSLGIGQKWSLGVEAFSGSVPVNDSAADKAAAAFGQGRTEVSPAAMAVAAASVARGGYLPPSLVQPATAASAPPLTAVGGVSSVQELMRAVVTEGTGRSLRAVPGGPVSAKTGTAEATVNGARTTRAWMIGWQGELAFAVLVEEGASGGTVAGPIAATFLSSLS